jgi:hypothetical protein
MTLTERLENLSNLLQEGRTIKVTDRDIKKLRNEAGRDSDKIYAYLKKHGKMSGRAIVRDLGLDQVDIEFAEEEDARRGKLRWGPVRPVPGGSGTWYGVKR